jgi:hypothetical protein
LDLSHPVADRSEALTIRHIVDERDALSSVEVRGRDGSEPFLSSSVPNLEQNERSAQLSLVLPGA